ncbi:MAG: AAA-like domain-containing protein, partial [Chloroflexota bacterium]
MSAPFFTAGGTLHSDAPSYVTRPADEEIDNIAQNGELGYVLTTRQMGKSSLMTRAAASLHESGLRTAILDLTAIGTADIDSWYLSLLDDLQGQLELETDVEAWWDENGRLSPVRRFTKFMREILPGERDALTVIFIDEVDSALHLPFSDDFFAAIRALFNQASPQKRLSIILLGVAQPNDLIKEVQRTPFNVGRQVVLNELALENAVPVLSKGFSSGKSVPDLIKRIFYWTDGHPYLTQKVAQGLAENQTSNLNDKQVDSLVSTLFLTEQGRKSDSNLQFVAGRMTHSPNRDALFDLYHQVWHGKRVDADPHSPVQNELKLYGLVRRNPNGQLTVRNEIYRAAFDRAWINERRQAGRWWVWLSAAAIMLVILALVGVNLFQQGQSEAELIELNVTQFNESNEGAVRLSSLGRLIDLDAADTALDLFESQSASEQLTLFRDAGNEQVETVALVIENSYPALTHIDLPIPSPSTDLINEMAAALERTDPNQNEGLRAELESWERGRRMLEIGNDEQARIDYSVAIALNPNNPATRFERLLIYITLGEIEAALDEIDLLNGQGLWDDRDTEQLIASSMTSDADLRTLGVGFPPVAERLPTVTTIAAEATSS